MKDLPGGIAAFYPPRWRGLVLIVFGAVFAAVTFPSERVFTMEPRPELVFYGVVAVCFFRGLKGVFWPRPVCLLYPEKARVGKKELFWDQIESCYERDELRRTGKSSSWVKVLVLLPKPATGAELLKVDLSELSGQDRDLLKREIAARGVSFVSIEEENFVSAPANGRSAGRERPKIKIKFRS